jgi:mono/diheme cytochrome c family protein
VKLALAPLLLVALAAGCGEDAPERHGPSPAPSMTASAATPAPAVDGKGLPARVPDPDSPGAQVVIQSGCLACHELAGEGNDGPGPDLTTVGSRLSREELRRSLIEARAPMPSYRALPEDRLDALISYLAARG